MNTLTGQKAVLAEVRQREFEAYNQVKKSCHMVEQAQLEKAEVHPISIKLFCASITIFPIVHLLSQCLSPPMS